VGRIALTAVRTARAEGIPVGLLRPITLNPFPEKILDELSQKVQGLLVVEANTGQMLDDVILATRSRTPVEFYGRLGGMLPMPDEILAEIKRMVKGPLVNDGQARTRWMQRMAQ
jgi:2-oxoglutarate ferredoxin oxidoreductase subunit alpha